MLNVASYRSTVLPIIIVGNFKHETLMMLCCGHSQGTLEIIFINSRVAKVSDNLSTTGLIVQWMYLGNWGRPVR